MNLALDLKIARRRSGLSQSQVAHLLGVHRTRLSKLEKGRRPATAHELATLSVIFSLPLSELGRTSIHEIHGELRERLDHFPNLTNYTARPSKRADTLNALVASLPDNRPSV